MEENKWTVRKQPRKKKKLEGLTMYRRAKRKAKKLPVLEMQKNDWRGRFPDRKKQKEKKVTSPTRQRKVAKKKRDRQKKPQTRGGGKKIFLFLGENREKLATVVGGGEPEKQLWGEGTPAGKGPPLNRVRSSLKVDEGSCGDGGRKLTCQLNKLKKIKQKAPNTDAVGRTTTRREEAKTAVSQRKKVVRSGGVLALAGGVMPSNREAKRAQVKSA